MIKQHNLLNMELLDLFLLVSLIIMVKTSAGLVTCLSSSCLTLVSGKLPWSLTSSILLRICALGSSLCQTTFKGHPCGKKKKEMSYTSQRLMIKEKKSFA